MQGSWAVKERSQMESAKIGLHAQVNPLRGRQRCRGAVLVEMAFVLPILLVLFMGVFWMGRAFNVWETLHRAAREGARVAATKTCASCSSGGGVVPTVGSVETAVMNSLSASSIDTTKVQIPSGCTGNQSTKICYARDRALNSSTNYAEPGVLVSLSYPVKFPLPTAPKGWFMQWHLTTITLTASAQMREEN